MAYIYKITNDINQKIYIGKTQFSLEKRFKEHCKDAFKRGNEKRPLYSAIQKYGIEHFHIEEIEECLENEASEREKYWIEYFGTFKNGYNATKGGDGLSYLDYDLVVKTYEKMQNQKQVAKLLQIDEQSVREILKLRGVVRLSQKEVMTQYYGKCIGMFDLKTQELLKTFSSATEAAEYLVQNNKANSRIATISGHIRHVCNKKRKSAYSYYWEFI